MAQEDLTSLLKLNKHHTGAYHSKAMILARNGKHANAIYNLSHAINLSPKQPDLYLLRAELYEKVSMCVVCVGMCVCLVVVDFWSSECIAHNTNT